MSDDADIPKITENIKAVLKSACNMAMVDVLYNNTSSVFYHSYDEIYESRLVSKISDGLIGLHNDAVFLFDYFDNIFSSYAKNVGCIEKKYPVLLPLLSYKKTGYLKRTPQYSIFCCELEENIDRIKDINDRDSYVDVLHEPHNVLSPSACFHVYDDIEKATLPASQSYTLKQAVFRNEGRFNWNEYGRLKSYTIRELVFIGDQRYVRDALLVVRKKVEHFLSELDLVSNIQSSSDSFILPEMGIIGKIQLIEGSKYEVKINTNVQESLACASFNFHGVSFSKSFEFKVKDIDTTVSGCIGFGLERWVLAFLCQYGIDSKSWPSQVQEYIFRRKLEIT